MRQSLCVILLFSEYYLSAVRIHRIYDGKRLKIVSKVAYYSAADLKSLFDRDTEPFYRGTGIFGNRYKSLQSTAVCKKIVDDQYMILGSNVLL